MSGTAHFPYSVTVDPTGKFAYVVSGGDDNILAYAIGTDGALTTISGSPFATGSFPSAVVADPTGKFVYVANERGHNISAYHIDAIGGLKPVTGSPFTTGSGTVSVAVDPTGKFVYVPSHGEDDVFAFSIGADGALKPVPGSPFAAGKSPESIAVDPTGKFVYVGNYVDNQTAFGSISAYSIGAKGALTPVPGSPFKGALNPASVTVDPTGRFFYAENFFQGPSDISAYSIGADGALTPVPGSPFTVGGGASFGPQAVAVDPTGKFVYVPNVFLDNVSVFHIGNNGALTPVTGSPFAAGSAPISVAVSPFVPFASSSAELDIRNDIVSLSGFFTLGANSNGIDPVTENVTLQIGTFSVTIPAGSFKLNPDQSYGFKGGINGVSIEIQVSKTGQRLFIFDAVFTGLDLTGITNPETVVLTFGINSGSAAANVL